MADIQLRFLAGKRRGETLRFSEAKVRIGRSRDNELVLPESESPTTSGHHAELVRRDRGWWLTDLESTNGTFVNSVRLVPGKQERLRNGDRLGLGGAPILTVLLPQRSLALPLAALVVVVIALGFFGYRGLRQANGGFQATAASVSRSVYLIALEQNSDRQVVASGFAIGTNGLLATTAHVVEELEKKGAFSPEGQARAIALLTDSTADPIPILEAYSHPAYEPGSFDNDVVLVQVVPGTPLVPLPLAEQSDLAQLSRGCTRCGLWFSGPLDRCGKAARATHRGCLGRRPGRQISGNRPGHRPWHERQPYLHSGWHRHRSRRGRRLRRSARNRKWQLGSFCRCPAGDARQSVTRRSSELASTSKRGSSR